MEINVRKTIENTVTIKDELPFYIDELSANDEMPTYMGMADEKYTFSEMDDDFFDFVNQKINDNGIYIRLVHIIETSIKSDCVTLNVEAGSLVKTITVKEEISSQVIDYGIKVKGNEVLLGRSVFDQRPHFSKIDENDFLAKIVSEIVNDLISYD